MSDSYAAVIKGFSSPETKTQDAVDLAIRILNDRGCRTSEMVALIAAILLHFTGKRTKQGVDILYDILAQSKEKVAGSFSAVLDLVILDEGISGVSQYLKFNRDICISCGFDPDKLDWKKIDDIVRMAAFIYSSEDHVLFPWDAATAYSVRWQPVERDMCLQILDMARCINRLRRRGQDPLSTQEEACKRRLASTSDALLGLPIFTHLVAPAQIYRQPVLEDEEQVGSDSVPNRLSTPVSESSE